MAHFASPVKGATQPPKYPFLPGDATSQDLLWRQSLGSESAGIEQSRRGPLPILVAEPSHASSFNGTAAARSLERDRRFGARPSGRDALQQALGSSAAALCPERSGSGHSTGRRRRHGSSGTGAAGGGGGGGGSSSGIGSSRRSRGSSSRRAAMQVLCSSIQQEAAQLHELSMAQVTALRAEMEAEAARRRAAESSLDSLESALRKYPFGQAEELGARLKGQRRSPASGAATAGDAEASAANSARA